MKAMIELTCSKDKVVEDGIAYPGQHTSLNLYESLSTDLISKAHS